MFVWQRVHIMGVASPLFVQRSNTHTERSKRQPRGGRPSPDTVQSAYCYNPQFYDFHLTETPKKQLTKRHTTAHNVFVYQIPRSSLYENAEERCQLLARSTMFL